MDADPAWREIRQFVLREHRSESLTGLMIAHCTLSGSPVIAEAMLNSQRATDDTQYRAVDTWLYIYELIDHGIASTVGEIAIKAMHRQRSTWNLPDSDYRFLLSSSVVHPLRLGAGGGYDAPVATREGMAEVLPRAGRARRCPERPLNLRRDGVPSRAV